MPAWFPARARVQADSAHTQHHGQPCQIRVHGTSQWVGALRSRQPACRIGQGLRPGVQSRRETRRSGPRDKYQPWSPPRGVEADAHTSALANQTPSWRARNGGWRAGCSKSRGGSLQGYLERGARPRSIGARNPRSIGAVVSLVATACTALVAHSHAPTKRTSPSAGRSMRARRGLARGVGAFRRQHTPRFPSNG